MTQNTVTKIQSDEKNSKLMKGIIIGGIVGGVISLLDSQTRNSVKTTAVDIKDSSMNMISQVKENPGEVKNQMIDQFKSAAGTLKDAINDAQQLYERVNQDIFGKVNDVMEISTDTLSTVKDAQAEITSIGSKVAEAGSELADTVKSTTGGGSTSSSGSDVSSSKPNTVMPAIDSNSTNFGEEVTNRQS
ncbi:hypothetical protein GJU40_07050 [Bacillus lacus]|uniref:YtxH domain-containing protein n=1 Tax=Metabacillus lacus TaxID=1983721 RepID=A0A7X2LZP4_9BACI|nr:hypothetical protein [Metabacillus lacus]MRX71929.1 hypothetical protein [Metabacillus lacus]